MKLAAALMSSAGGGGDCLAQVFVRDVTIECVLLYRMCSLTIECVLQAFVRDVHVRACVLVCWCVCVCGAVFSCVCGTHAHTHEPTRAHTHVPACTCSLTSLAVLPKDARDLHCMPSWDTLLPYIGHIIFYGTHYCLI